MDTEYKKICSPIVRTIEECGELIHILCKAERFGLNNYHPSDKKMTPNKVLIHMEMEDLRAVLNELEEYLIHNG